MKKLSILFFFLFLLSGCAGNDSESVTSDQLIGKTIEEAGDFLVLDEHLLAYGYGFATDHSGNPVILEWEIDEHDQIIVTKATVFDKNKADNAPESFDSLEEGMTIYQVVEKVGIPTGIPATGIYYLEFTDSDGNDHWLAWHGDPLCLWNVLLR